MDSPRLIVAAFIRNCTEQQLQALVAGAFDVVETGEGALVSSNVNGSSFSVSFIGGAGLSKLQVMQYAELALQCVERGLAGPVTRTKPVFS